MNFTQVRADAGQPDAGRPHRRLGRAGGVRARGLGVEPRGEPAEQAGWQPALETGRVLSVSEISFLVKKGASGLSSVARLQSAGVR